MKQKERDFERCHGFGSFFCFPVYFENVVLCYDSAITLINLCFFFPLVFFPSPLSVFVGENRGHVSLSTFVQLHLPGSLCYTCFHQLIMLAVLQRCSFSHSSLAMLQPVCCPRVITCTAASMYDSPPVRSLLRLRSRLILRCSTYCSIVSHACVSRSG